MAARIPKCRYCDIEMAEGYTLDLGDDNFLNVAQWIEGNPNMQPSSFLGVLTLTIDKNCRRGDIQTFRCPKCGYLESFVPKIASGKPDSK